MKTKRCQTCKEYKPTSEFYQDRLQRHKDGYHPRCRTCGYEASRKRYKANSKEICHRYEQQRKLRTARLMEEIDELKKTTGCHCCPENTPVCLDFHHLKDKKFTISEGVQIPVSREKLMNEIAKCVLVCANCHRKLHAGLLSI